MLNSKGISQVAVCLYKSTSWNGSLSGNGLVDRALSYFVIVTVSWSIS